MLTHMLPLVKAETVVSADVYRIWIEGTRHGYHRNFLPEIWRSVARRREEVKWGPCPTPIQYHVSSTKASGFCRAEEFYG